MEGLLSSLEEEDAYMMIKFIPHQEAVQKEWVKGWLLSLEVKKTPMMQFL